MQFIQEYELNDYLGTIIQAPALARLNEITKDNLKNVLLEYLKINFIDRTKSIQNFNTYKIDEDYIDIFFEQQGIQKQYYSKLNSFYKKIIAYFIERLYQSKGSEKTLNIFSEIFENIFGSINFYRIIVVKKEVDVTDVDGHITRNYVLTYELEKLIINNYDAILTTLDQEVSLTGKHLMTLQQYNDFKLFPVKTNLVYIQFTSSQSMIDSSKFFNGGIRAYALTYLNNKYFDTKELDNLSYTRILGSDIEDILRYAEFTRIRLQSPNSDFNYLRYQKRNNLIMAQEDLETIENILIQYNKADYSKRKEITNIKRMWKMLLNKYPVTTLDYYNYDELKNYIYQRYPQIVDLFEDFTSDDEFINFYVNLYNYMFSEIDIQNEYLLMYINFIFLSVITGEAFLDNFFIPVYKLFQKYFFPIEMDFINELAEVFIIKDKFESFGTDEDIHIDMTLKGWLDKNLDRPDIIKCQLLTDFKDTIKNSDNHNIIANVNQLDEIIKNELFKVHLDLKFFDNKYSKDESHITINTKSIDKNYSKDNSHLIININEVNSNYADSNEKIEINSTIIDDITKIHQNDLFSTEVNSNFKDDSQQNNLNDKDNSNVLRYNYLELYDNLNTYLIMNNEKYRKLSSFEDSYYWNTSTINDRIYNSIHSIY